MSTQELLEELKIRFNTSPKLYEKQDFGVLIKVLYDLLNGVQGDKGDKGDKGDTGQSAYEMAIEQGYVGTQEQWLTSLKGEQGEDGKSIEIKVVNENIQYTDENSINQLLNQYFTGDGRTIVIFNAQINDGPLTTYIGTNSGDGTSIIPLIPPVGNMTYYFQGDLSQIEENTFVNMGYSRNPQKGDVLIQYDTRDQRDIHYIYTQNDGWVGLDQSLPEILNIEE